MPPGERDAAAPSETTVFTTLLLDIALKPISDAVGVLGSAVTDRVAERIARSAFEAQQ